VAEKFRTVTVGSGRAGRPRRRGAGGGRRRVCDIPFRSGALGDRLGAVPPTPS